MRYTLLDLTQNILSSMDSDEVNSINDTVESKQVVAIIKTVYNDIISRGGLTSTKALFNLTASGDNTKPVLMIKPEGITSIDWVRYNKVILTDPDPAWSDVTYLPPQDFIQYISALSPSASDVESFNHTVNGFTFTFHYQNNGGPRYYTSFDDNTVIFDSYDAEVDTTLQTIKTLCYGTRNLTFVEADSFVAELQPDQFSLLLNEAKSLAWTELKQTPHLKAETTARKNWSHLARSRRNVPNASFENLAHSKHIGPRFGRK